MTSHAAVVARGMGRPCVSGAGDIRIDEASGQFTCRGRIVKKGDMISIDGGAGEVLLGAAELEQPELSGDFASLMVWADKVRKLKVRTNADTPPVSYTHLDVYKRQIQMWFLNLNIICLKTFLKPSKK